ncbi:glycosyltransferase family 39 protein, partial [Paracoccus sp. (in: a-proteobacteria)]|uniref:glycosyltransferase family 39 protein n=1 Tax=Paracoccus sp. TaxID=267 RepID=UPI003A87DCF5
MAPIWSRVLTLSFAHPVVLTGGALVAQAAALSLIRTGTSFDGAEQLLYTQYWDWGYGRSQPPLYTWLLKLLHIPLGVTQLAENLLKFGLIVIALAGMLRLAQGLGYPRQAAVAAMFSLLLVQDVFWEVQRNYSHTALLLALLPWTLICWLRLRRAAWPHFALFGLLAGLLILSKYNAAIFLLAL